MRKVLISAAVGAATLAVATFASAQPAKADVGFYFGTPGVSVGYYRDRCRDYWYRRNNPYRCGGYYHRYRSGYNPYYRGYYRGRDRCFNRWYRETHPYRCRWWYRRYD
jgi:hypothetical protein